MMLSDTYIYVWKVYEQLGLEMFLKQFQFGQMNFNWLDQQWIATIFTHVNIMTFCSPRRSLSPEISMLLSPPSPATQPTLYTIWFIHPTGGLPSRKWVSKGQSPLDPVAPSILDWPPNTCRWVPSPSWLQERASASLLGWDILLHVILYHHQGVIKNDSKP